VAVKELEGEFSRSLGADVFNITPAPDVPVELASGNFGALGPLLRGTQIEYGKYFQTQTFVGLNSVLQFNTVPGFRIEHRFRRNPGLSIESTLQPRFFLPEPSLSEQKIRETKSFGLFMVRRWRF
jgi:translocation and assembly module TamB